MASKLPPPRGEAFTFRTALFAQSGGQIKTTPTIAAGDIMVSKDGAAFANPATLPSESPAGSGQVLVSLSASEMDADEVTVRFIDASGAEWHSFFISIPTAGQTFDELAATLAALNNLSSAEAQAAAAAALTAYDPPTKAEMDAAIAAGVVSVASEVVSASPSTTLYDVGDQVKVAVTFTDSTSTAADPTTVTASVRTPSKVETDYVYGTDVEVVKTGTGAYYILVTLSERGVWYVRFAGTGAIIAAVEQRINVRTSMFD